ncbi:MAG: DUF1080 domain-containing protein [Planctomycetes bacterium]|nr:DUF1080 domain-containing protein [Planctomycetota bacterium]
MLVLRSLLACSLFAVAAMLPAEDKKPTADGSKPLFNSKDLTGWALVNTHPDTFFVKDGEIITTGNPMGFLRTDKQYENFVLEMDWMHINKKEVGNSGLFVWGDPLPATGTVYTRGIEVQILVNYPNVGWATNHGDLFSIWGAKCVPDRPHPKGYERCLPSEERCKGGGEWNHYKVTANDGSIKLEVNGKEVSGVSKCNPRKGYLALESEGAECHFKNLTIKELPSTNPKPEEIANVSAGHTSLFNALDAKGWKIDKDSWKVTGGKLVAVKKDDAAKTEKRYVTGDVQFDWKFPAKTAIASKLEATLGSSSLILNASGEVVVQTYDRASKVVSARTTDVKGLKASAWNRARVQFDGKTATVWINGEKLPVVEGAEEGLAGLDFLPSEGVELMNIFGRELKEK